MVTRQAAKLIAILLVSSCSQHAADSPEHLHLQLNEDLVATMVRIDRLSFELEMTELQLDELRREEAQNLAEDLSLLADSFEAMKPKLENRGQHQIVQQSIDALRAHTAKVQRVSITGNYTDLSRAVRAAQATCNDCHQSYREPQE